MMVRICDVLLINCLILYISSRGFAETLLCVICSSDTNHDCEKDPPDPEPCPESTRQHACQTVEEKKNNGDVIRFIRACSTLDKEDNKLAEGCVQRPADNITVCYKLCFEDGCNSQSNIPRCFSIIVLTMIGVVLFIVL